MKNIVQKWGIKHQQVRFYVPSSLVIMRPVEYPAHLKEENIKEYFMMEIGETIVFLKDGFLEWSGDKNEILTADNEAVIDFVYSSKLFTKLREVLLEEKDNSNKK